MRRWTLWIFFVLTAAALSRSTAFAAAIEIGAAVVGPDGTATISVRLRAEDLAVGGVQNDILFDNSIVHLAAASSCRIEPAIADSHPDCAESLPTAPCKTLSLNLASCGTVPTPPGCEGRGPTTSRLRALIAATAVPNRNSLPARTVLYSCLFEVASPDRLPTVLTNSHVFASDPTGQRITLAGQDGFIAADRFQTPAPTSTPTPPPTATATRYRERPTPPRPEQLGGAIRAVRGEPVDVSINPLRVTIGDIDGDGFADAACGSGNQGTISFAFSDGVSGFDTTSTLSLGYPIGDVVLLDVDADGVLDVVTSDQSPDRTEEGRVLVLAGGLTNVPAYSVATRVEDSKGAERFLVGDFDRANGPDLAVADRFNDFAQRVPDLSILLNQGANQGFAPAIRYDVGTGVDLTDIAQADLDDDGDSDLVAIDSDGANDAIKVVALNDGSGRFPYHVKLKAGPYSVAVETGDFDLDGAADIAFLNASSDGEGFSLTLFLNRVPLGPQTRPVADDFGPGELLPLPCPLPPDGAGQHCEIRDLGAADFNADGITDLVVAIDLRTTDNLSVGGALTYLEGRGDGSFALSTSVRVGANPIGIAVADTTGDGTPDVVVAESADRTVSMVRTMSPDPRSEGSPCRTDRQCSLDRCVGGLCCASCPSDGLTLDEGDPCDEREALACDSGNCVDGVCCQAQSCPAGQRCDVAHSEGICASPTLDPLARPRSINVTTQQQPQPEASDGGSGCAMTPRSARPDELWLLVLLMILGGRRHARRSADRRHTETGPA